MEINNDNSMKRLPIVVIRSNDNCFLDVLRCCGVANIPVIPVIFTWEGAKPWLSEKSVYFKNPVKIVNPAADEQLAISQILKLGNSLKQKYKQKILIIPTSDTSHIFLQKNFEKLNTFFKQMGHDDFNKPCLNVVKKDIFAEILEKNKINTPKTISCKIFEDIDFAVKNITYPCIYKPIIKDITNSFQNSHNKFKAIECDNPKTLSKKLNIEIKNSYELVVQEKIEFEELYNEVSCYIYSDKNQVVKMISGQHKLDEYPKPYGTGFLSKFHIVKEHQEIAKRLAKALNWRGFIGIEFMKNKKTGKWTIIEANLRPWLSIFFQAVAGYNYIEMLYNDAYNIDFDMELKQYNSKEPLYRVNLSVLIDKIYNNTKSASEFLNELSNWFEQHKGKYVFTSYHPSDPEPALHELALMKNNYPKEYSQIIRLIESIFNNQI